MRGCMKKLLSIQKPAPERVKNLRSIYFSRNFFFFKGVTVECTYCFLLLKRFSEYFNIRNIDHLRCQLTNTLFFFIFIGLSFDWVHEECSRSGTCCKTITNKFLFSFLGLWSQSCLKKKKFSFKKSLEQFFC